MDKEAQFHRLIADLHGAALDANLWQPALQSAVDIFDVRAAHFFLWDVAGSTVPFSVCESPSSCEPEIEAALASYTSHYANLDYRRELTDRARPGSWMHCHEWTTPRALARNEFFNEFLRPANLRWLSGMRVSQASGALAYMGLSRGFDQEPMAATHRRMLDLLTPHLVTASRNFFAAATLRSTARQGLACLDAWPAALLIVGQDLRPSFLNRSANEALAARRPLRLRRGAVEVAGDIQQNAELQEAVYRAIARGESSNISLGRSPQSDVVSAMVMPIRADSFADFATTPRKALVVLNATGKAPHTATLRDLFRFTHREAELAIALLNGATPASVAAARGVAISTVRTQIRGLFAKTGTNRLPALIRVLGNAAPALLDS